MSKMKYWISVIVALLSLSFTTAYAQQNHDPGMDEVCALTEGSWHTSASGWACCWSNWGCYGCTGGSCLMNCHTRRCKKMNGMAFRSTPTEIQVQGLAPRGMKAPIVPAPEHPVHHVPRHPLPADHFNGINF